MYSNTILKLDLIVIIIQKYCFKYLKPDKDIDKIKKSKTIQFVLDQLNDIRKTKDFKVLKSIFTIEKKYKIKDLKDWLGILCANKPGLFLKHFNIDIEIDMTKGYRTYVNLLSKLGNNKTKVDLKEPNNKISILFNLLFYDVIVVGGGPRKKHTKDKSFSAFFALQQTKKIDKKHQQKLKKIKKDHDKSIATGQRRWRAIVRMRLILRNIRKKYGREFARESNLSMSLIDMLFRDSKADWFSVDTFKQSLKEPVPRPYNKIYPIVQQSDLGSCWINSILVALMYPYHLKEELLNIIIVLLEERTTNLEQQKTSLEIYKASVARIIQNRLRELLVLQYGRNFNMTGKECIHSELSFVKDFITELTNIPTPTDIPTNIFSSFSQVSKHPDKELNDIILDEGGTFADIFELIKILLTSGLEFVKEYSEHSIPQFYTKTVNDKKITICVIEKPETKQYTEYLIPGFQFASIILRNYEKTKKSEGSAGDMDVSGSSELADMLEEFMEEEKQVGHVTTVVTDDSGESMEEEEKQAGHVTTVVTDDSGKLFLYNGWMTNHSVTPLQQIDPDEKINIKSEDNKKLYFNLFKSSGIMILLKVE